MKWTLRWVTVFDQSEGCDASGTGQERRRAGLEFGCREFLGNVTSGRTPASTFRLACRLAPNDADATALFFENQPVPTERIPADRESTPEEDLELVRHVFDRNRHAQDQLADSMRCIPRILRALNVRMGRPLSEHDLADLGQDVSMITLRKLGEFEGRSRLEGWIFRICSLEIMNGVRRRRRRHEMEEPAGESDPSTGHAQPDDPWRYEELYRGLERLDPTEAEVVQMKHFDDLTFDEIGVALAISPNTAKTRYYRGLEQLHVFMAPQARANGS